MTRVTYIMIVGGALAAVGCDGPGPGPAASPAASALPDSRTAPGADYVFHADEFMKPAYREVRGLPSLKADASDDVRWASPERYAITQPPPATARAMLEYEPMRALVMAYPSGLSSYQNATATVAEIAREAAAVADVWMIVDQASAVDAATAKMLAVGMSPGALADKVSFIFQPVDSVWFIDSGPLPLVDDAAGSFAFADFRYYHQRPHDDGIPTWLGRTLETLGAEGPVTTYRMPVTTEGGTFQATGDGVCFTGDRQLFYMSCDDGACDSQLSFQALDDLQVHPLTQELETFWGAYAGCKDVVVLHSITDDGTGHIDMFFKALDDDRVLVGEYREPFEADTGQETNAARMDANAAFLEAYQRPGGGAFEVSRLVMPGHRVAGSSAIPFTYINSTFINGLNLWPAFHYVEWLGSRAEAEQTWEAVLPDYDHVWIDSTELSFWSGAIHCITRTIPDAAATPWVPDGVCEAGVCTAAAGFGDSSYLGACAPHGVQDEVCWGPGWTCECNDCDGANPCEYFPSGDDSACAGVGLEGCCVGDALQYCDGGELGGGSCGAVGCGWDADNGWYECGFDGADPDGEHPRSCDDVDEGCVPDCDGRACGVDGCGGTCGGCLPGQSCSDSGQCEGACVDQCTEGIYGCDGSVAFVCVSRSGCTDRVETGCHDLELFCHQGACVPQGDLPPPDDDGCAGGGGADGPPHLLLLALCLLALGGRRWESEAPPRR